MSKALRCNVNSLRCNVNSCGSPLLHYQPLRTLQRSSEPRLHRTKMIARFSSAIQGDKYDVLANSLSMALCKKVNVERNPWPQSKGITHQQNAFSSYHLNRTDLISKLKQKRPKIPKDVDPKSPKFLFICNHLQRTPPTSLWQPKANHQNRPIRNQNPRARAHIIQNQLPRPIQQLSHQTPTRLVQKQSQWKKTRIYTHPTYPQCQVKNLRDEEKNTSRRSKSKGFVPIEWARERRGQQVAKETDGEAVTTRALLAAAREQRRLAAAYTATGSASGEFLLLLRVAYLRRLAVMRPQASESERGFIQENQEVSAAKMDPLHTTRASRRSQSNRRASGPTNTDTTHTTSSTIPVQCHTFPSWRRSVARRLRILL